MDLFGEEEKRKQTSNQGPITGYSLKVIVPVKKVNIGQNILIAILVIASILGVSFGSYYGYKTLKTKREERKILKAREEEEKLNKMKEAIPTLDVLENDAKTKKEIVKIPDFDKKMNEILSGKNKEIYLVFVGGPRKKTTKEMLEVLEEQNIDANFFLLGKQLDGNEELIKEIYNKNNYVSVTGDTEDYIEIYKSAESVAKSVEDTATKLKGMLGEDFNVYTSMLPGPLLVSRFDYLKTEAKKILNSKNIDTMNFNQYANIENEDEDLNALLDSKISANNNIVLLIYESESANMDVFKNLISKFKTADYTFKTLYDLTKEAKSEKDKEELKEMLKQTNEEEKGTGNINTEVNEINNSETSETQIDIPSSITELR